ncbi:MAG: hypothetical protein JXQ76_02020 [Campylobacterales bacterium]|nr:hypothetical protein [Campylobacterales bacterium]
MVFWWWSNNATKDDEGNWIIIPKGNNGAKVILKTDGRVEHIVTLNGKTTRAIFDMASKTTVDANGTIITVIQKVVGESIFKAVVETNKEGRSKTRFVKINLATNERIYLANTLRGDQEFNAGSLFNVFNHNNKIYIKSSASLEFDFVIE